MHRQGLETLNEGIVKTRGHLLPAIVSTDRTIAHREFMKPLEDAEAEAVEFGKLFPTIFTWHTNILSKVKNSNCFSINSIADIKNIENEFIYAISERVNKKIICKKLAIVVAFSPHKRGVELIPIFLSSSMSSRA